MKVQRRPETSRLAARNARSGAALCYRTICTASKARMCEHRHPEVTLRTFPLADYNDLISCGDWQGVGDPMSPISNEARSFVFVPVASRGRTVTQGNEFEEPGERGDGHDPDSTLIGVPRASTPSRLTSTSIRSGGINELGRE